MKTLWLLLGTLLLGVTSAHAAVLSTDEFEGTRPGTPWSYSTGAIVADCAVPASPSGGCALRFTYVAGTYSTSTSGGIASRNQVPEQGELYVGHWLRFSNPFVFNPVGSKIDEVVWSGRDTLGNIGNMQCAFRASIAGEPPTVFACTNQIRWGLQTQNHTCNIHGFTPPLGTWFWYEYHVKDNSPGGSDGIYESWFNDQQCASYSNIQYRDVNQASNHINTVQHPTVWGGGGGTIPVDQYAWYDHTVISTTRIGCPVPASCGAPPIDTQAPTMPTNFTVSP